MPATEEELKSKLKKVRSQLRRVHAKMEELDDELTFGDLERDLEPEQLENIQREYRRFEAQERDLRDEETKILQSLYDLDN